VSTDLHATYRVQFHAGFGFAEAAAISDYLAANSVSGTLSSSSVLGGRPSQTLADTIRQQPWTAFWTHAQHSRFVARLKPSRSDVEE